MKLQADIFVYFIKLFIIGNYVYFSFRRILNINEKSFKKIIIILVSNLLLSIVGTYIEFYINTFFNLIIICCLYGIVLGKVTHNKIAYSIIIALISYAICEICSLISVILVYLLYQLIYLHSSLKTLIINDYFTIIVISIIQFLILYKFFKFKRLKNGFDFLKNKLENDYLGIIVINISMVTMIIYCLFSTMHDEITKNLFIAFVILAITMFVVIQKTFVIYYKQKLLKDTIKQYETELKEKDNIIKKLSNEKYEISRINHEFYNRQKALELKVKEFTSETSNDIGILDRIENLTKEYSQNLQNIKGKEKLQLTSIPELDDMFSYMQSECKNNNIDFKLQIQGEIYYLVNNIIPTNKLETLIGDLLRNAIIAINSSDNKYKSILTILGIKEECYELCVCDSGIEFEINTLLKLGLERATTYKETGGSGIGFMTTFKTLEETKASLIIEEKHEMQENDYTKAIKIRFDGKNEYKIISYRADSIKEKCKGEKRIIIYKI